MNAHCHALILAGGRGTRFWPRSRKRSSKQVLNVVGTRSLIQATVDRLSAVVPPERIWVLTNRHLRDTIVAQLPEVPAAQILAEPAQRNTAPAIGLAAHILRSVDPEAVMGVFPADHVIADNARFAAILTAAYQAAASGKITVVGVKPRWAEPGYGYVEFPQGAEPGLEPAQVLGFREKPSVEKATQFLAAGNFYWNAGMFFWRAQTLLEQLRAHLPQTASLLASLPPFGDDDFAESVDRAFPLCENISIDFAVLERAAQVYGIAAADFGWNDVGGWNAVWDLLPKDANQNAAPETALLVDAAGNFVEARGKRMVALLGVENLVVVDTPDALLITTRDQAHRVGELVKALEKQDREELL